MPAAGAPWRGEQLALLAGQLHTRQTSSEYAELLDAAETELGAEATQEQRRNLQLLQLELKRQRCLDPQLVSAITQAQSRGNAIWQAARARNDFSAFAPALKELIELRRQQASQLASAESIARSPWEILAQPFEPDVSKARLNQLFTPLKRELPVLLEKAAARPQIPPSAQLSENSQNKLCAKLLQSWGYNESCCQHSRSAHPFSCTLGPQDFRITTRVVPGQPLSAFLATAHEWGHSLYEQGLPRSGDHYFPWPLGDATSMGVHESQSLFWECRVARSKEFAGRWHPHFCAELGSDPWNGSTGFWRSLNPLQPGLIRVEADELSYCLHIVLRFELELALIEQELPVEELPQHWNQRLHELLGIKPANDSEGCLQDIHWAEGLCGYFPSYALGHLISAQLAEAMENALGGDGAIATAISAGQESTLLQWLNQNVYPLGRSVNSEELVEKVSGYPLSADPFLRYLNQKCGSDV